MYVRCPDCLSSTWVDVVGPEGSREGMVCPECSRQQVFAPAPDLGDDVRGHYSRTLRLATDRDLDMGSAYAVLLGIMSVEQAEAIKGFEPMTDQEATGEPASGDPADADGSDGGDRGRDDGDDAISNEEGRVDEIAASVATGESEPAASPSSSFELLSEVDPDFREAIDAGRLTVPEALRRGNRKRYAAELLKRHGLAPEHALAVADNRMSLARARRIANRQPAAEPPAPAGRKGVPPALVVLLLVLVVPAFSTMTWRSWVKREARAREPIVDRPVRRVPAVVAPLPQTREETLLAASEVVRDAAGRVTEILGSDPRTVLERYCEATGLPPGLEPIEIRPTFPKTRNARLGLFRDHASPDSVFAIRIRQDHATGRWIAGSGRGPVQRLPTGKQPGEALASAEDGR